MARHLAPMAAAELRAQRSRRELREVLLRLRRTVSRPAVVAAAAAVGALAGFSLERRGRVGALAWRLGRALLRHGLEHLVSRRVSSNAQTTPAA